MLQKVQSVRELTLSHGFTEEGSGPRALLAYEDFELGLRAMDLFAAISREAGADAEPQLSVWSFDFFERPDSRDMAAFDAEKADVIIVALRRRDHGLPAHVNSWVEQWTRGRKPRDGALVVIFDSAAAQETGKSEMEIHLQSVARANGMDFFCGVPSQAETSPDPRAAASISSGAGKWMDGSSPPRWGINE